MYCPLIASTHRAVALQSYSTHIHSQGQIPHRRQMPLETSLVDAALQAYETCIPLAAAHRPA